jgi:hypothetical protein
MVMAQVPALFLPPTTRSVNVKKTSVKPNTSKKKSNKNKGSMNEQKKNDATQYSYLLRTDEEKTFGTRISGIC